MQYGEAAVNNDTGNAEGIFLLFPHQSDNSLQYAASNQTNQSLNLTITYISSFDSA